MEILRRDSGLYIVIEGTDGSGKTTQSELLVADMQSMGRQVISVREPGGTDVGEAIRHILLTDKDRVPTPSAEAFLFYAARAQLGDTLIRPAREEGVCVVSDRNELSSLAYQSRETAIRAGSSQEEAQLRLTRAELRLMGGLALRELQAPDYLFIIDVPLDVAIERKALSGSTKDKIESRDMSYQRAVAEAYSELAVSTPGAILIDGTPEVEVVHANIMSRIDF